MLWNKMASLYDVVDTFLYEYVEHNCISNRHNN